MVRPGQRMESRVWKKLRLYRLVNRAKHTSCVFLNQTVGSLLQYVNGTMFHVWNVFGRNLNVHTRIKTSLASDAVSATPEVIIIVFIPLSNNTS